jgi:GTP1/Obg family GTP-binding protein
MANRKETGVKRDMNTTVEFVANVTAMADSYGMFNDVIDELAQQFNALAKEIQQRQTTIERKGRLLRIGIIGQTNVGKSSLLNTIFFNGKDILPKASTPMTAALTRLHYSEHPLVEIEFYGIEDWREILDLAETARRKKSGTGNSPAGGKGESSQLSLIEESALDVVKKAPADANEMLGKIKKLEADDPHEMLGVLSDYAGANGRYTSLVKKISLGIPSEPLREIEVIDTPGLNDPIVSRSKLTRDYLGRCDVILVLSYSGSFLDSTDMDLIVRTLPSEGVDVIKLIATKIDSSLVSVARGKPSFEESLRFLRRNIDESVKAHLRNLAGNKGSQAGQYHMAARTLESALPVLCISTMAEMLADGPALPSEEQELILSNLNSVIPGVECDRETLKQIGNLQSIRGVIRQVRTAKEEILAKRLDKFLPAARQQVENMLEDVRTHCYEVIKVLQTSSIESLRKELKTYDEALNTSRSKVSEVFNDLTRRMASVRTRSNRMARARKGDYANLEKEFDSWQKTEKVEKPGRINRIKRFFKLESGFQIISRTITEEYLRRDDVIDQISSYAKFCRKLATKELNGIVDCQEIAGEIKTVLAETIRLSDAEFDIEALLNAVDRTVKQIPFPEIKLNSSKYGKKVARKFSSKVKGDEITSLRKKLKKALKSIGNDLEKQLDEQTGKFRQKVARIRDSFNENLRTNLQKRYSSLEQELKNSQAAIEKYQSIISKVEVDLLSLRNQGTPTFGGDFQGTAKATISPDATRNF